MSAYSRPYGWQVRAAAGESRPQTESQREGARGVGRYRLRAGATSYRWSGQKEGK